MDTAMLVLTSFGIGIAFAMGVWAIIEARRVQRQAEEMRDWARKWRRMFTAR